MPLVTLNNQHFAYDDIVIFELDDGRYEVVGKQADRMYKLTFC